MHAGPDGKFSILYDANACSLRAFSASLQQAIGGDEIELAREVRSRVTACLESVAGSWPTFRPELPDIFLVNGAGNFAVGGPEGDNGLSGKKLVVDGYGPRVPIGGGALSGKDFYKADRAGALLARRLAKSVVMTGGTSECTATLCIFPGDERFRIVSLAGAKGLAIEAGRWSNLIDLSLAGAGDVFTGAADTMSLARYGHFTEAAMPWERIVL